MKLKYILFFIIFLSIYLSLNFYIGYSILNMSNNIISISKKWFWAFFILLSFAYIISILFYKYLPNFMSYTFGLIGSYWMLFFGYALILFPVVQLINLILKITTKNPLFLNKVLFTELIIITIFFVLITVYGSINAKHSYVNTFNISTSKLSENENLNIVMVSDLHLGTLIGNKSLNTMVNEINSLHADIVILAGDIVDSNITPFVKHNMANAFSKLKSTYGVYAALGNHDLMVNNIEELVTSLEKSNVTVLRDEAKLINNSFYIIGRDDISINRLGSKRKTLEDILMDTDKSKFKIVIDHTPSSLTDSVENNISLHFSGHTHKGQIIPGNFITKKIFEIDHGHLDKNGLNVIVSSGYGTWGPPIRIGSKSEIINVKIN